jgi:hypothetical protein
VYYNENLTYTRSCDDKQFKISWIWPMIPLDMPHFMSIQYVWVWLKTFFVWKHICVCQYHILQCQLWILKTYSAYQKHTHECRNSTLGVEIKVEHVRIVHQCVMSVFKYKFNEKIYTSKCKSYTKMCHFHTYTYFRSGFHVSIRFGNYYCIHLLFFKWF